MASSRAGVTACLASMCLPGSPVHAEILGDLDLGLVPWLNSGGLPLCASCAWVLALCCWGPDSLRCREEPRQLLTAGHSWPFMGREDVLRGKSLLGWPAGRHFLTPGCPVDCRSG
eukprot:5170996-Heterocapsa_arctica.AAC.1